MASGSEPSDLPKIPKAVSPIAPLLRPVQAFLSAEASGGIVLLVATIAALVWANSPWAEQYKHFWHAKLAIAYDGRGLALSLEHWVNDGLMVIFFLLVGLEIKRELLTGELSSPRQAALPIAAALGGMIVPALIFVAVNFNGDGRHGWGVPMATDIAFAVGVLALVGRGVPASVKIFLLAIAIVDDLGAIVVIALFYSGDVSFTALGVAGGFLLVLCLLNLLRVHRPAPYLILGVGLWLATLASGIHATIAGVLLAFTIPASRSIEEQPFVTFVRRVLGRFERDANEQPDAITPRQGHAISAIIAASEGVQTPLARVEHALLRPVNFLIVPLFALANAGVDLRGGVSQAAGDPVMWGVLAGLFVGKPIGVMGFSWLAVKARIAAWPTGASHVSLAGVAVLCGIGFTMSLFVANLAFPNHAGHLSAAKVGILGASLLAGACGAMLLRLAKRPRHDALESVTP